MVTRNEACTVFSTRCSPRVNKVRTFARDISHTLTSLNGRIVIIAGSARKLNTKVARRTNIRVVHLPYFPLVSKQFPLTGRNSSCETLLGSLNKERLSNILIGTEFCFRSLLKVGITHERKLHPIILSRNST